MTKNIRTNSYRFITTVIYKTSETKLKLKFLYWIYWGYDRP